MAGESSDGFSGRAAGLTGQTGRFDEDIQILTHCNVPVAVTHAKTVAGLLKTAHRHVKFGAAALLQPDTKSNTKN